LEISPQIEILSFEPEEVFYYPQGYCTGLEIKIRDRDGREYKLQVGSFTAMVRLERA
jgi:hypothetical protein